MFRYTLFLTSSLRSLAHRQRGLTDVQSTSNRTSAASAPELPAGEPTEAGSHATPPGLSGGVFWGEPARCCLLRLRSAILSSDSTSVE